MYDSGAVKVLLHSKGKIDFFALYTDMVLYISEHLKGGLGPAVRQSTFFNLGGWLGPRPVRHVMFLITEVSWDRA